MFHFVAYRGKVHLCCNKCQGPEQTRPNRLGKDLFSGALFNEESAATRPHDMRRSPQQHSTTKSAIQQAQPIISHPDAHEVMEVSADAGTKLHDHQFLQFVGHLMSLSASPT